MAKAKIEKIEGMEMQDGKRVSGDKNDRLKAIDVAVAQIEKQFGSGSIMTLGEQSHLKVETSSSGSIALDHALGGGYAKGRIIEIY